MPQEWPLRPYSSPGTRKPDDFFLRGTKFDIIPGNKENKAVKEGEWHTLDFVITGDKVEHKIDNQTVRTSKATAATSPFKLRARRLGRSRLRTFG